MVRRGTHFLGVTCKGESQVCPKTVVLFLFFGFAVSSTMTAPFLDHVVRDRECIQSLFVKLSSGFATNQELSASAVDNSLIPRKKTVRTLYF